ncbi:hypothetical protein GGR57DRAFT_57641 [Xylariaceae sp. FL1272]|nr:hypothetical protein GGR57DRAFT_57641 [Xylariaceae sp. FL1272]
MATNAQGGGVNRPTRPPVLPMPLFRLLGPNEEHSAGPITEGPRCTVDASVNPNSVTLSTDRHVGTYIDTGRPAERPGADVTGYVIDTAHANAGQPVYEFVCTSDRNTDDHTCGSVMRNTRKAIGSHCSKLHKEDSAYMRDNNMHEIYRCLSCGDKDFRSKHNADGHARRHHGYRGRKDPLFP